MKARTKKVPLPRIWCGSYRYVNQSKYGDDNVFEFFAVSKEAAEKHVLAHLLDDDEYVEEEELRPALLALQKAGKYGAAIKKYNTANVHDAVGQPITITVEKVNILT